MIFSRKYSFVTFFSNFCNRKAVIGMFSVFMKKTVRQPDVGTTQVTGEAAFIKNSQTLLRLVRQRKFHGQTLTFIVSEYLKGSNSAASTKRRIITKNGSAGYDIQELQYVNSRVL